MTLPQLQESEDEKKDGAEKKDDSIVYADLDKSAMSEGENHDVILDFNIDIYCEDELDNLQPTKRTTNWEFRQNIQNFRSKIWIDLNTNT